MFTRHPLCSLQYLSQHALATDSVGTPLPPAAIGLRAQSITNRLALKLPKRCNNNIVLGKMQGESTGESRRKAMVCIGAGTTSQQHPSGIYGEEENM